jgi:hypothetical protein
LPAPQGHFLRGASHASIKGILEALNLAYLVAGLVTPQIELAGHAVKVGKVKPCLDWRLAALIVWRLAFLTFLQSDVLVGAVTEREHLRDLFRRASCLAGC